MAVSNRSVRATCWRVWWMLGYMGFCLSASAKAEKEMPPAPHLSIPTVEQAPVPPLSLSPSLEIPEALSVYQFSLSVERAPVRTLLAALAREAQFNLDLHSAVEGEVTLHAVHQTLDQLLARIARQVSLRAQFQSGTLSVLPDAPYVEIYQVDYVNVARTGQGRMATSSFNTASEAAPRSRVELGNTSSITVTAQLEHQFWRTLASNLETLLNADDSSPSAVGGGRVVVHAESGVVAVRARSAQHEMVKRFLNQVGRSASRQVLIEATLVEVTLSKQAQAGVDWSMLAGDRLALKQVLPLSGLSREPLLTATLTAKEKGGFSATLRLLESFGRTRVLSSPRIVALNNQMALLRVVDEKVYFTLKRDERTNRRGEVSTNHYTSEPHTISVGMVMSVTPQISDTGEVVLAIRPSLSRITGYREDPLHSNNSSALKNKIPEIELREFESLLRVRSGQTVVLGGLMEDRQNRRKERVPGLADLPWIGPLFESRSVETSKNELIILLRPIVLPNAEPADFSSAIIEVGAKG